MTTEEKLKHFQESSINSAYEKSAAVINGYKEELDRKFEEHKAWKLKRSEDEIAAETDAVKRENNDKYSNAQNYIKKELSKKSQEITEKIFDEVISLLNKYKKRDEYKELLIKQIGSIRTYARWGEEQLIYIDSSDAVLKDELEKVTNCTLTVSEDSFVGGIRAIVNNNILIDNSFLTKLDELRENFNLSKCITDYDKKNIHHGGSING